MIEVNNTVPAEGQMINSSDISFLGNENAPLKILVLGNSITRHGPRAELGWDGDYGMAASCAEKDYVHQLYTKLTDSGKDVYMYIRQASYWEVNFSSEDCLYKFDGERDFGADMILLRLGENVKESDVPFFAEAAKKFIDHLNSKGGRVFVTTCFWKNESLDREIKRLTLWTSAAVWASMPILTMLMPLSPASVL